MKKPAVFLLSILTSLTLLTGCGTSASSSSTASSSSSSSSSASASSAVDISAIKTIGDIEANRTGDTYQRAAYDNKYVYVFELNGTTYRATAPLSQEQFDEIMDIDILADDHEEKTNALIADIPIEKMENLSERIPSQEELNKYVGKTGGDLLSQEWTSSGYNLETMEFFMEDDTFRYVVTFEGSLKADDSFDEYEAIRPLIIKEIRYDGIGSNAA